MYHDYKSWYIVELRHCDKIVSLINGNHIFFEDIGFWSVLTHWVWYVIVPWLVARIEFLIIL